MTYHYQKEYMSFFEPEWAESDSTLLFASEFSIWKIRRWGGMAVRFWKNFNFNVCLDKPLDISWSLQPSWSPANRLLSYLEYTIYDYMGTIDRDINIESINEYRKGFIEGQFSHPSWSPEGERIACYREGDVWIYNIKELVDKVLDGIP